jgi:hypothetical protein
MTLMWGRHRVSRCVRFHLNRGIRLSALPAHVALVINDRPGPRFKLPEPPPDKSYTCPSGEARGTTGQGRAYETWAGAGAATNIFGSLVGGFLVDTFS